MNLYRLGKAHRYITRQASNIDTAVYYYLTGSVPIDNVLTLVQYYTPAQVQEQINNAYHDALKEAKDPSAVEKIRYLAEELQKNMPHQIENKAMATVKDYDKQIQQQRNMLATETNQEVRKQYEINLQELMQARKALE